MPACPADGDLSASTDIVVSVRDGSVDFGVTGLDVTLEYGGAADEVLVLHEALGFGGVVLPWPCRRPWSEVRSLSDLVTATHAMPRPLRVATKFTHLTEAFFAEQEMGPFELVYAEGTPEVAPAIGHAGCIVDLVSSGQTLQDNRLRALDGGVILAHRAALVANRAALRSPARGTGHRPDLGRVH